MNPPTAAREKIHLTESPPCCERAGAAGFGRLLLFGDGLDGFLRDVAEAAADRFLRA